MFVKKIISIYLPLFNGYQFYGTINTNKFEKLKHRFIKF